jgi:hypothetical protein
MAGATERVFVAPPIPTGGGKVIAAPFQFYTTGEDNLRIVSLNSLAGVTLKIQARLVNSKGELQAASWDHTPNSDRTAASTVMPLAAGSVLNLTVFANSGSPRIGQTFVIVQLIRGLGQAAIVLGTLLQGYVTSQQALAWPGSPCISSTDGEPNVRNILGSSPPAGTFINEVCPTGARWELITFFFNLVTSATPGNRSCFLEISSSIGPLAVMEPAIGQTASTTLFYTFGQNLAIILSGLGGAQAPIPPRQFLRAGDVITVGVVGGMLAGDIFTPPNYQVREWLEAA